MAGETSRPLGFHRSTRANPPPSDSLFQNHQGQFFTGRTDVQRREPILHPRRSLARIARGRKRPGLLRGELTKGGHQAHPVFRLDDEGPGPAVFTRPEPQLLGTDQVPAETDRIETAVIDKLRNCDQPAHITTLQGCSRRLGPSCLSDPSKARLAGEQEGAGGSQGFVAISRGVRV